MYHKPVLLTESIEGLSVKPDGFYVDTTFGSGGHSRAIFDILEQGKLFAFDQDVDAEANLFSDDRFVFIRQNFRYLKNFLQFHKAIPVDGILADLGVSSHQFNKKERGFSIRFDAPLDSRMNASQKLSAKEVINHYDEDSLKRIFTNYGEIHNATKLSRTTIEARKEKAINTTFQLIDSIENCIPKRKRNQYLAKVFQAIRIEINDELEALKDLIEQSYEVLKPKGRLVVIAYHSLEDRLVKNYIRTGNFEGILEKDFYGNKLLKFKAINNKPIVPSEEELQENNRARSAKLRIAEKI